MQPDTDTSTDPPHQMSFNDLMMLTLKFNDRLDSLWQRVIYTHAALVGVMVFFSRSPELFLIQRWLVFFLYSVSSIVTFSSIRQTYIGYRSALEDLAALQETGTTSSVQNWVKSQSVAHQPRRFGIVFVLVWAAIGYLLIFSHYLQ